MRAFNVLNVIANLLYSQKSYADARQPISLPMNCINLILFLQLFLSSMLDLISSLLDPLVTNVSKVPQIPFSNSKIHSFILDSRWKDVLRSFNKWS